MADVISDLFIRLTADTKQVSAAFAGVQREARAMDKVLKPITKTVEDIGKPLAAAGAVITGTLLALTKVAANYGDALDETAEKTGLTVQQLARLKYAGEQMDTSFEGVSTGIKFLSKNLFEAATGSKEQEKVFRALGVETKTATGGIRSANDVLLDMSAVFQKLPDGAAKTAIAMKVFGKAGQDLIPFLNQGPEGLKKLGDEAERFNIVIDPPTAKLGDEFVKALDRSKTASLGLALSIGNVLLPSLTALVDKGNEAIIWASGTAREFPNAAKAALAVGAALTALGGGLLALAAIGTIAPKVASGLMLLQGALAPASILLGVRSYGDLSTAIALLGQTSLIAKLGMIGLAAGIGIAIGQLINMGIEMAGLQPKVDAFFGNLFGFNKRVGDAQQAAANSTDRAAESLKKIGVVVERGTMTQGQYEAALAKAMRAHFGLKDVVVQSGKATTDYDKMMRDLLGAMEDGSSATTKTKDAIRELTESFISSIRPADELSQKMTILLAKFDEKDIVSVYGEEIIAAAAKQRSFGVAVDDTIAKLEKQALVMAHAAEIIKANRDTVLEGVQLPKTPDFLNVAPIVPATDLSKDTESLNMVLDNLDKSTKKTAQSSAEMFEARRKDTEQSVKDAEKWRRVWENAMGNVASSFADNIVGLFSNNKKDVEGLEQQITDLQRAKERDRLQLLIDNTKKGTTARKNAELQMQAFEKQVQQEQNQARDSQLAKLQSSLNAQTNLFRKFASSIKDVFVELGKSLLKIFIVDTFAKIAKSFSGLFDGKKKGGLLDSLGGLFGGKGGGNSGGGFNLSSIFGGGGSGDIEGGLLKKILPKGLQAALGIGGSAALSGTAIAGAAGTTAITAGPAAGLAIANAPMALGGVGGLAGTGTAAAGTAGAGGGLGASLTALATNPITIAAAAAIVGVILIKKFVGAGRKTANEFVQSDSAFGQNKFGQSLSNVIDPLTAMRNAGTETLKDANAAKQKVLSLWKDFQDAAGEFAKKGKNQAKVVAQAFDTLRPIVNNLLGDIEKDRARLGVTTGGGISGNGRTGPGIPVAAVSNIPQLAFGGFLKLGGLALLHRGEMVIPADVVKTVMKGSVLKGLLGKEKQPVMPMMADMAASTQASAAGKDAPSSQPVINIAPVFNIQKMTTEDKELSDLEVRKIMEKMTVALSLGVRGFSEEWSRVMNRSKSPGTTTAVGI